MAKCAGCSGGISEVSHSNTNCIHLTGLGTLVSPLVATLQIDPASPATITCGVSGLSVAGGGGPSTCGQKTTYSVATIGLQGLGFDLGTQEPFFSCADFIGDGLNDEVAINAACTAAVGTLLLDIYPEVYLNSGVYDISASIQAKTVSLKGSTGGSGFGSKTLITNDLAATGFPLLVNPSSLFDIALGNLFVSNAEATVQANMSVNMFFERCIFTNVGLGTGNGVIEINTTGNFTMKDCRISCGDGTNQAKPGTYFDPVTSGGIINIIGNTFIICTLDLNNMFQGSHIKDNNVQLPGGFGGSAVVPNRGAINLVHPGTNVAISNWQLSDNIISNVAGHGIYIDGGPNLNGFFAWAQVHNNLIYSYGGGGVTQFDGIILLGHCDQLSVQGNKCYAFSDAGPGNAGARHGINISAATCNDNLVTNNDLFGSGGGASLNDAGTATVLLLAAGNRL